MERMLEKMARQLLAFDEASLMNLWQRYALRVHEFEPTRNWEEAALILNFIQAVRWKNQLFNYHRLASSAPAPHPDLPPPPRISPVRQPEKHPPASPAKPRAKVLRFPEKP